MIYRAHQSVTLPVPAETAFAALTAYESYPSWIPGVEGARVLAREGGVVVVELRAPRLLEAPIVLEVVESPPSGLRFRQIDRVRRRGVSGDLRLGATGESVELQAELSVRCAFYLPVSRRRLRRTLARLIDRLSEHLDRLSRDPPGSDSGEQRTKILEVRRHQGHLQVWLRGQMYRIEP